MARVTSKGINSTKRARNEVCSSNEDMTIEVMISIRPVRVREKAVNALKAFLDFLSKKKLCFVTRLMFEKLSPSINCNGNNIKMSIKAPSRNLAEPTDIIIVIKEDFRTSFWSWSNLWKTCFIWFILFTPIIVHNSLVEVFYISNNEIKKFVINIK